MLLVRAIDLDSFKTGLYKFWRRGLPIKATSMFRVGVVVNADAEKLARGKGVAFMPCL